MSLHTICPSIIQDCSYEDSAYYYTNILLIYTQNNPYKVCLDKEGKILIEYGKIAKKNEFIRLWIKLITNHKTPSIEYIQSISQDNILDILLDVCNKSFDKVLVVNSKIECVNHANFILENGITVLDKDEIILHLDNRNININAHNSQISLGDSSPNIKNNNNENS